MIKLDSHIDTLHEMARKDLGGYDFNSGNADLRVNLPRLQKSGINAVFFVLFFKQSWDLSESRQRLENLIGYFNTINKNHISLCSTPYSIRRAVSNNKIAACLAVENGSIIGDDLSYISALFDRGIRYITLCHNSANQICDSSTGDKVHNGLSSFGKKVIQEMNKVGMMIDVSHASDETVNQVLDISELPIIASHSNCFKICNTSRNLKVKLIEKLVRRDGVIQNTLLPKCIASEATITNFKKHVDYLISNFGVESNGFGSDFDGGGKVEGCEDISNVSELGAYNENFWGENFLRVFERNLVGQ